MKYICPKVSHKCIDICDHAQPHDLKEGNGGNDCDGSCSSEDHVKCVEIKDNAMSSREETKNLIQNIIETMQSMQDAFSMAGGTWEHKDFSQTTVTQFIETMARNNIRFEYVGKKS